MGCWSAGVMVCRAKGSGSYDFLIFLGNLQRAMLFLEFLNAVFPSSFHRALSLDHQLPIPLFAKLMHYCLVILS